MKPLFWHLTVIDKLMKCVLSCTSSIQLKYTFALINIYEVTITNCTVLEVLLTNVKDFAILKEKILIANEQQPLTIVERENVIQEFYSLVKQHH